MRSGQHRHWIKLQHPAEGSFADDGEERFEPYTTYFEGFAYMRPDGAGEGVQTDQLVATASWSCTVRWVEGATSRDRLLYDGRTFQIVAPPIDPDGKRWTLEIKATEVA